MALNRRENGALVKGITVVLSFVYLLCTVTPDLSHTFTKPMAAKVRLEQIQMNDSLVKNE